MVKTIAEWAEVTGAETLELRVTEANAPAVALYRGASFVDTGTRSPLREGSPVMTMTMRRQLRPPGRAVDRG
jgi:ribosomal protein S18 acetylase RimI-like enzyme